MIFISRIVRLISPLFIAVSSVTAYQFSTVVTPTPLNVPNGVAVDISGNVYVVETNDNTVRKITPEGVVTTIAGLAGVAGNVDSPNGANARFSFPQGIAVDGSKNIYVADAGNNAVRKITALGEVTTLAAGFNLPYGVAVDAAGIVYVADTSNNAIQKISPTGVVTTLAGAGAANPGNLDGIGIGARFNKPIGVTVDSSGNVYVADSANHNIRKITSAGVVTTLAGSTGTSPAAFGYTDATGSSARFSFPHGVAVDEAGSVYVSDTSNNVIRKITPLGVVSTFAGAATPGNIDGSSADVRFNHPNALVLDSAGNLYIADAGNNTLRKGVDPTGPIPPEWQVAGTADFDGDGQTDIVWRNTGTGDVIIWLLNGATAVKSYFHLTTIPVEWQIVGTADFDGDKQTDIMWRNTRTGDVSIWLMSGPAAVKSYFNLTTIPLEWQIVGTTDFDGDKQIDIMWRNTRTGDVSIWLMNGATAVKSYFNLTTIPLEWQIVGTADFDGDGQTDIMWQNTRTGDLSTWLMNGAYSVKTYTNMTPIPLRWLSTN